MGYRPTFVFIYTPIQPRNTDLLRVSIYPSSPVAALSIPFPTPKYRIWDLTPTRQYLSIRPCGRRYRMWDIAPRQYLSIPPSSQKYRIWDMPHVSIYLSPFPARNIGYGYAPYARNIDLLGVSIYLSAPSAADIGHGNIKCCPTSVFLFQPEI